MADKVEKNITEPVSASEDSEALQGNEAVLTDAVSTETPVTTTSDESTESTDVKATPVITMQGIEVLQQTETIIIFKVTRPLMAHEYEELSARVRSENQASGLKIVLAPAIVDGVEISG